MYEYQFNIAHNGVHLFRTDWYDMVNQANRIEHHLALKFKTSEGYEITRTERSMLRKTTNIHTA